MSTSPAAGRVVARDHAELSYPSAAALDEAITPGEHFFVRDHLSVVPALSTGTWRLSIDGLVRQPLALTFEQLLSLPQRELIATLECAGNGNLRRGMKTAVGTARWRGVPLVEVLELAGLDPGADGVVLTGADHGHDPDQPDGPGRFERSVQRAKAMDADTIVAFEMNGAALPVRHGYPVRLVVPGHYGMDSVKWLSSITPIRGPFGGFYSAHRYREKRGSDGLHTGRYVREVRVKSLITHPLDGQRVDAAGVEVRGVAWAGGPDVAEVGVSSDGGQTWAAADLSPRVGRHAWRRWSLTWEPPGLGVHELVARATDAEGETQPLQPLPERTYEANWVHRVTVWAAVR